MSSNPIALSSNVQSDFQSYVRTTFPILDTALRGAIELRIAQEHLLWKGPFITLRPPLRKERSIQKVAQGDLLVPGTVRAFEDLTELFVHQEDAIRLLAAGRNLLLSSGTGSGKTESFLIPAVDLCLRAKAAGQTKGVKVALVYPMNALANDQLERLRVRLKGTGVTFGRLTGETKENDDGRPHDLPDEERWSRDHIRNDSPDILVTNYAMLEHILLRHDEHWRIFEDRNLKLVVLDEVHTYTGARGADVALLLRRLKARASKEPAKVQCVGTSATLARGGGPEETERARQALKTFAGKIFGVEFSDDELVVEATRPEEWPAQVSRPPFPASLAESHLRLASEEDHLALARLLLGAQAQNAFQARDALRESQAFQAVVEALRKAPSTLSALADVVAEALPDRLQYDAASREREVVAYLLLGAALPSARDPLLKLQVHVWFRGIRDFTRCMDPSCGELHTDGEDTCRRCKGLCLPLEVCRSCGQDFLRARRRPANLAQEETAETLIGDEEDAEGALHLAPHGLHVLEEEEADDEDAEERDHKKATLYACRHCGQVGIGDRSEKPCARGGCPGTVYAYDEWIGKLTQCPACKGRYGTQEVVTTFRTATPASVSVITRALLANLPEPRRRLLIFADNRQDTAYQAGYLKDRHRQFTIRQIFYRLVREADEGGHEPHDIESLVRASMKLAVESRIEEPPQNPQFEKRLREDYEWEVVREFFRKTFRRISLEGLGLVDVRFPWLHRDLADDPRIQGVAQATGRPVDEVLLIVAALLHEMRLNRAGDHPILLATHGRDVAEARRLGRDEYRATGYDDYKRETSAYRVRGYLSPTNNSWLQDLLSRLGFGMNGQAFLAEIRPALVDKGYVVRATVGRQATGNQRAETTRCDVLNPRKLTFHLATTRWQCSGCRRMHMVKLPVCTAYRCQGTLQEVELDHENHYVRLYTERDPVKVLPAEHSGQLGVDERQDAEEDFRDGRTNVLVCTPTMELGVNIGDLDTVLLRNAPPNAGNYVQRAGRAGRSDGSIALVNVFTQPTAHDVNFYLEPREMLAGEIRPPSINLGNLHLIKRQARSVILGELEAQLPRVLAELLDMETGSLQGLGPVTAEVERRGDELGRTIGTTFEGHAMPQVSATWAYKAVVEPFAQDLHEVFRPLSREIKDIMERLKSFPLLAPTKEIAKERARLQMQAFRLLGRDRDGNDTKSALTTAYLQRQGFLPTYGFPAESVRLTLGDRMEPVTRDPSIAVTEFAPHNFVYVAGGRYQVRNLTLDDIDRENARPPLQACTKCDWIETNPDANFCVHCSERFGKGPLRWVSPMGAFASYRGSVTSEEEARQRRGYKTSVRRMGERGHEVFRHKYTGAPYGIRGREIAEGEIVFLNQGLYRERAGPEGKKGKDLPVEPFTIHLKRGTVVAPGDHLLRAKVAREHGDEFKDLAIGYLHRSNLFIITMENVPYEDAALPTLESALLLAARLHLDADEGELKAFLQRLGPEGMPRELVFYESIPGGIGYLHPLARELPQVARRALDHLRRCPCEKACYRCLKTYWNQRVHYLLDKRLIVDALMDLAKAGSEPLKVDAPEQKDGMLAASPPVTLGSEGRKFDTPAEEEVFNALVAAGLPKPKVGYHLSDGGGRPIARADLAYPDRRLLIFIDGEGAHANARQRALDEEQREDLEDEGWTVRRVPYQRFKKDPDRYVRKMRRFFDTGETD